MTWLTTDGTGELVLDLERMRKALFDDEIVSKKVAGHYEGAGLRGAALRDHVLKTSVLFEATAPRTDAEVLKAAMYAWASNMRRWFKVRRNLRRIGCTLKNYNIGAIPRIDSPEGERVVRILAKLLSGYTRYKDAQAIVKFANQLADDPGYYARLCALRDHFLNDDFTKATRTAAVAMVLGRGPGCLHEEISRTTSLQKIRGMGPVLASEFLRNLGWEGFKPDRHVVRLLKMWAPKQASVPVSPLAFADKFRLSADVRDFWIYSLLGERLTPDGTTLNEADFLVWMMGIYVEKKG